MKRALSVVLFTLTLAFSLGGGTAHAAPSCVDNMLADLLPVCYNMRAVKLTIHKRNNTWISYTEGNIRKATDGSALTGNMSQLFSDRVTSSGQPFDRTRPDTHRVTVQPNGQITVTNVTWGFTTVLTNTSCIGNVITANTPSEVYILVVGPLIHDPLC